MKVKELKRLLSYFSEEIDVIIEDRNGENSIEIEDVAGFANSNGKFSVRLLHESKDSTHDQ